MIACLKGTLIATSLDTAVIDVQGVGYQVLMASKSLARLGTYSFANSRRCSCSLWVFKQRGKRFVFASSFGFQCWAEGGFSGAFHF